MLSFIIIFKFYYYFYDSHIFNGHYIIRYMFIL